ncbi:MAG: DUF5803 family protein [Halobacteriaceae archaeon]
MTPAARRGALALLALALLAGCAGAPSDAQLNAEATYDWETDAAATYDVRGDRFRALYRVDAGQSVAIYQTVDLGGETALPISGLRFRYPNGSVLRPDGTLETAGGERRPGAALAVEQRDERTVVTAPADGRLAYTAPTQFKHFHVPILVEGSHEVVLPPDTRISVPILGLASPGGYERTIEDGRVHLRWGQTPSEAIDLQYYLQRDLYIYGGLVGALLLAAVGGTLYYRRQIRALERHREEAGIDVE